MPPRAGARALAGACLAVCVASCSPTVHSPSLAPGTPSAEPLSPTPTTTLTVLDHQALHLRAMEEILPMFEEEMAARGVLVEVVLEAGPEDDEAFVQHLRERYRAGDPPDLTSFPGAFVPEFADTGRLLDLTDHLAGWPDWVAHFYRPLRDRARQADGRYYSVPRGANVIQLFYRRDVLESNGISTEQPVSWRDLIERMRLLERRMARPPLLIPAGRAWGGGGFDEGFINLMLGTGSELYDDASERWVVESAGLDSVFAFYETIVTDGLLPVQPLLEPMPWETTKLLTFVQGDLAVTTQGTWGWTFDWGPTGSSRIVGLDDKVATWAFPSERPNRPFVWAAENWMWTIPAETGHPDLAFDLLRWLNTGRPLAEDLVAVGNVSPRDDIAGVQPYASMPHLLADERQLVRGRSFKPRVGIREVRDAAATATERIISGELGAAAAAKLFADLVTAALGAEKVTREP